MKGYKMQKMAFLIRNPLFQKEILLYRKKWNIPKNGHDENVLRIINSKATKSIETIQDINKINEQAAKQEKDRGKILLKFNLPKHYDNFVHGYLLTSEDPSDAVDIARNNLKVFFKPDDRHPQKQRIFIEIYAETTLKNIKDTWNFINDVQRNAVGFLEGRQKPKNDKIFERDLLIYDLVQKGNEHKKIKKEIKEKFPLVSKGICDDDISRISAKVKQKIMNI